MTRVKTEAYRRNTKSAEVKEQMSRANEAYGKGAQDDCATGRSGRRGKVGGSSSFDEDAMDLDAGLGQKSSRAKTGALFGFGKKR